MNLPRLIAAATLTIILAACGGSTTSPSGTTTPTASPAGGSTGSQAPAATATPAAGTTSAPSAAAVATCDLFTVAELKTATGADYGAGVPDSVGQCVWRVGGATANNGDGQIAAGVQAATLDFIKSTFAGGVDLTAGGHAAYWNPNQGLQSIWIDIGAGRVLVLSLDPVDADSQAVAQKLAEIAVAKV